MLGRMSFVNDIMQANLQVSQQIDKNPLDIPKSRPFPSKAPKQACQYFEIGCQLYWQFQFEKAIQYYEKGIQIFPDYDEAYIRIGNSITYKHQNKKLLKKYNNSIYCTNYDDRSQQQKNILMNSCRIALKYYDKAIEISPDNSTAYNAKAVTFQQLQQTDQAIQYYKKAIEVDPHNYVSYYNLSLKYKENDPQQSIRLLTKSIELEPRHFKSYYSLAQLFEQRRQYNQAIHNYTKVILRDPNNYSAYVRIGMCFSSLHQNKNAIDFFQKAIAIKPSQRKAYQTITFPYIEMGQYKKALQYINLAIQREKCPLYYCQRADIYLHLNQLENRSRDIQYVKKLLEQNKYSDLSEGNLNYIKVTIDMFNHQGN